MKKPRIGSLAQVVETYYDELRHFIRKRTNSSILAEDVIQETWIRARNTQVAFPDNPRAYVYRMAGNLAIDLIRKQASWEKIHEAIDETATDSGKTALSHQASTDPAPHEIVTSPQELAALDTALAELPSRCRQVFLLYRGQGLSMREVALHLSISEKTVEKHIAQAMMHCRDRLRKAGHSV